MSLPTGGCWEVGGLSWRRETGSRGSCVARFPKDGACDTEADKADSASAGGGVAGRAQDRAVRSARARGRAWRTGGEQGLGGRRSAKPQRVLDDVSTVLCPCLHRRVHTWDNRRGASDPSLMVTHTPRMNPQICKDHAPSGVRPRFCGTCQTTQSHRETQWLHGCQELGGGAGEGPRIRTELLLE